MTQAICIFCGAMKFGCLVACPACGMCPATRRESAYSFLLSDHYQSPETLSIYAADIATKVPLADPETEAQFIATYGFGLPELPPDGRPDAWGNAKAPEPDEP